MKWIAVLSSSVILTACTSNNTDAIERHQIIASPENRWVHWGTEAPLDVTEAHATSKHHCPSTPSSD